MIDVKTLSFELLVYFTPSEAFIRCIFQKAISLAQSSKFGECESASLLFTLCLKWNGSSSSGSSSRLNWLALMHPQFANNSDEPTDCKEEAEKSSLSSSKEKTKAHY